MRHMRQKIRFCLGKLIMTVPVDPVLYNNTDLPEKFPLLFFFQDFFIYTHEKDRPGILSII